MSQINDKNIPNLPDDDDEFGGYVCTKERMARMYKVPFDPTIENTQNIDEDDEFGGYVFKKERFAQMYKTPSASTTLINDDDNEFGGAINTIELIYKRPPATVVDVDDNEETLEEILIECKYPIFSPKTSTNQWLIDRKELSNIITNPYKSITIPLIIDTEFCEDKKQKQYQQKSRLGLTTQVKSICTEDKGVIFAHSNQVNAGRKMAGLEPFLLTRSDFHPIDYLNHIGLDCEVYEAVESELTTVPKCFIVLYGHFLTAEINMICSGTIKEKIKQLQREQGDNLPKIDNGRRAYCEQTIDGFKVDWISLKHIISIDSYQYELCVKLVDTGAIHGVASYKSFCEAVGWKLRYKDNFTSDEKSRMLNMSIERPTDFENYALGDLEVFEALENYDKQWQLVYEKLELSEYYQTPKLTIGGTVKDLFESSLASILGIVNDDENDISWQNKITEIIEKYIQPSSADSLRKYTTNTRAMLSKVEGGRCRNNRPVDIFIKRKIKDKYDVNLICDIDISGCYGEGQRNQDYFFGIPEVFDYDATANNDYVSLKEWLIQYGVDINKLIESVNKKDSRQWKNLDNWGELLPGAWYARIRTKQPLKYSQDYFASWFTESGYKTDVMGKFIEQMKCDTELTTTDWVNFDEETGSLKIFNNEIHNGVLTHDGLQWILAICSPRQRNELLNSIQVLASSVYPRSQKIECENSIDGLQKLEAKHKNWKGKNTTKRVKCFDGHELVRISKKCHGWFSVNLGKLIIDNLLIERKKAQKQHGKKSPLDVLFKLCVNTLYGDMVSKFFVTSNPVVGNNITARARSLAWYMEKGLNGWQSITDGCGFELNGVLFSGRDKLNGEIINLHRKGSKLNQRMIKCESLNNVEFLMFEDELYINQNDELILIGKDKIYTDENGEKIFVSKGSDNKYINTKAMEHLQNEFSLIDVLNNETTAIKVNDNLTIEYVKRIGQFSFETKDVYWCGAFHGSANYILCNGHSTTIKARGYEVKKPHTAIEGELLSEGDETVFYKSERYGSKNNPAKDFLQQLLDNSDNVTRQLPAIKSSILKISDYKNLSSKYDELGIEPGDNVLKSFLLQEFSLSQFTFKTYEQYMMWKKIINHLKDTDKQSLEGFFLNNDGSLNFIELCQWVDEKISEGVTTPFEELDKHRNKSRSEKRSENQVIEGKGSGKKKKIIALSHPNLETFKMLKERLNLAE